MFKKVSKSSTDSGTGSSAGQSAGSSDGVGRATFAAATATFGVVTLEVAGVLLPDTVLLRAAVEVLFSFDNAGADDSSNAGVTKSSNLDVAASNLFASLISSPFILVAQIGLPGISKEWYAAA